MAATVVVIAQGEMGAGISSRLHAHGARVLTSLAGRSAESAARAARAGVIAINDDARLVAEADFVLSVIPPGESVALARRLAPALAASNKKPIYLDGNAISPKRAQQVAAVIEPTQCPFVDGGIIGGAPSPEKSGARIYVSGPAAVRAMELRDHGLDIRLLEGPIGEASATKLSYASLTKGTQAIGAAMMLGAMRANVAPAVRKEFAETQQALGGVLARQIPNMYHKAYRWVAEMEEIADYYAEEPGARDMFRGAARLFESLAQSKEGVALLDAFLERGEK
jgi:L-threonate 2-dehydrogenase